MEQQLPTRIDPVRVVLALVLLPLAVLVAWIAVMAVWHFPQPVYRLIVTRLLVTFTGAGMVLAGARAVWECRQPGLALVWPPAY